MSQLSQLSPSSFYLHLHHWYSLRTLYVFFKCWLRLLTTMFSTDHHDSSSSRMYTSPTFQRPRTALRGSSARVPISRTAAYSWLQVQQIMESSGHVFSFFSKFPQVHWLFSFSFFSDQSLPRQPKSESSENKPATTHEQPSMMAALLKTTRNNNLSASSSSSSLNSSVSSDSFSADGTTSNAGCQ